MPIPEGSSGFPALVAGPAEPRPVAAATPVAPQHPFLAANGRSNIHNDAHMTDVNEGPGPLGRGTTRTSVFESRECASLTFDRRGRIVTICVGLDRPVLTLKDPVSLRTLAALPLPPRQLSANPFQDFSGGGYFYLDERDRAVVPTADRHLLVVEVTEAPAFRVVRDVDLNGVLGSSDKIVSVLPDWAGRMWIASDAGVVATIARDTDDVRVLDTGERIANSFAVDDTGGVFIVTDGALYRFDAGPDGAPRATWREAYANIGVQKPGQGSAGSGTTPTLMAGGLLAITDNADPMNVVVYRRGARVDGPREVCRQAVFTPGASSTDNSLIAVGGAIVVENNFGYTGPTSTQDGRSTSPGVERVDVDAGDGTCRRVWRSEERSPSVVPKLSLATGLVYVYVKEPRADGEDVWYLTGIDFATGRTAFKAFAGEGLGHNNNYAPVTLGPDGSAYVGVLGGLLRLADAEPPPTPAAGSGARGASPRCRPARATAGTTRIANVRLGAPASRLRGQGARIGRRSARFCVRGGGAVRAALRRGRAQLVVTTAPGHRAGRLRVGARVRDLPRRRAGRGAYVVRGRLVGVRGGRVRWIAVTRRAVLRSGRARHAALRAVGLR